MMGLTNFGVGANEKHSQTDFINQPTKKNFDLRTNMPTFLRK